MMQLLFSVRFNVWRRIKPACKGCLVWDMFRLSGQNLRNHCNGRHVSLSKAQSAWSQPGLCPKLHGKLQLGAAAVVGRLRAVLRMRSSLSSWELAYWQPHSITVLAISRARVAVQLNDAAMV
ncbi:unnamed protein product [Effrenium voratum]|uniref:Uncharacterized protein n=1 Tax=Effrenium voratum TaxID=2562239 RepID=A0AA36MJ28_9DINO|nr:unnamed protein product [Effrenium voratum]